MRPGLLHHTLTLSAQKGWSLKRCTNYGKLFFSKRCVRLWWTVRWKECPCLAGYTEYYWSYLFYYVEALHNDTTLCQCLTRWTRAISTAGTDYRPGDLHSPRAAAEKETDIITTCWDYCAVKPFLYAFFMPTCELFWFVKIFTKYNLAYYPKKFLCS